MGIDSLEDPVVRESLPYGQKRALPVGTMLIVLFLGVGLWVCMAYDDRNYAVIGLLFACIKLFCLGWFFVGVAWALYLLWGKDRDTNAALLSLGLSVACGAVVMWLMLTGQMFTW